MSLTLSSNVHPHAEQPRPPKTRDQRQPSPLSLPYLAEVMTREASTQTYFTIRRLADRSLRTDAYRAYAYFRWVDDVVDELHTEQEERLAFLSRQQEIIARCYRGEHPDGLCPEEYLVVDLIHHEPAVNSGLFTYINEMMAVMVFDATRKGRFISEAELTEYTRSLATAVTEALHYFIGHNDASPQDNTRYLAVTGAHITHMLRDAFEDTAVGYYNVPQEFLDTHHMAPDDMYSEAYRTWVKERVQLARSYFAAGRKCLARVENWRCRLAGYAYISRFEMVLDAIEKDDYWLRAAYPERKSKQAALKMGLAVLGQIIPLRRTIRRDTLSHTIPSLERNK